MSNRLAHEKSPYLLQHRNNPVDWRPWGEEAFEEAKRLDKPIFLSIGYSTCHWCHVMAHESFENEAIAQVLNQYFVPVKLDREERPDIDQVYMTYVQATTGHGGWPMSVWLTPDLKPIYGGTYFPPEDRWGRIGFGSLLEKLATLWKSKREELITQSEEIFHQISHYASSSAFQEGLPSPDAFEKTTGYFLKAFDPEEGGFSGSPKFPRPVCIDYLSRIAFRYPKGSVERSHIELMIDHTLRKMARGGMNDQVGGGFHRYSVDALWHVPHYEKMLYDQAQLVVAYLRAYRRNGDLEMARTARRTLDYVRREMRAETGGFYSAEDADSLIERGGHAHAEGAFYVWSLDELKEALQESLNEDYSLAETLYRILPEGNSPEGSDPHGELIGKNTLKAFYSLEEISTKMGLSVEEADRRIERIQLRLLEVRAKRPRPHLDDKIITAWNGLMISAFAQGYVVLGDRDYLQTAEDALAFILKEMTDSEGDLIRSYREGPSRISGFCEDYAFLIQGLLDLYEVTLEEEFLEVAIAFQGRQDELFWDEISGGYFGDSGRDPSLLIRMKTDHDGAEPSANSVSALNLVRMARVTGDGEFLKRVEKIFGAFKNTIERSGGSMPLMLAAFDAYLNHPLEIVIVEGEKNEENEERLQQWIRTIHRDREMDKSIVCIRREGISSVFQLRKGEFVQKLEGVTGWGVYRCRNQVCDAPVSRVEEWEKS